MTSRENETLRFVTNALRVRRLDDRRYDVLATDGKVLGIVTGTSDDPADYPTFPELDTTANGSTEALIPRGDWQRMLGAVPKALARSKPILGNVACVMGDECATLGINAVSYTQPMRCSRPEGRYPNVDDILDHEAKKPTKAYVALKADQLITLAQTVKAICGDDAKLVVEIKSESEPVHFSAKSSDDGLSFRGLIMPVATPDDLKPVVTPKREPKPITHKMTDDKREIAWLGAQGAGSDGKLNPLRT